MLGPEFDSILEEAKRGSAAALAALYREFQPATLAYLRARARNDAEDLASDAWIDIARGLGSFTGTEERFRAWIFTITRRRLIDARRRQQRRATDPADVQQFTEFATDDDTAEAAVQHLRAVDAIAAIEQLTTDQADVLLLRVLGELSVEETAVVMGKRPGTIRVLQHRALQQLARILGEPGGDSQ